MKRWTLLALASVFVSVGAVRGQEAGQEAQAKEREPLAWLDELDYELHGFWEARAGYRTQNDEHQKDMSIMEMRFQLDLLSYFDWGELKFRGDYVGDAVTEEGDFDLRELYVFTRPTDDVDLKVGRQILTWGTGDLIFINDLFPKDWVSFFIGRDDEYLKAPSDSGRLTWYNDAMNVDFVYTPKFESDRYIDGDRLSYWSGTLGQITGRHVSVDDPDTYFHDDEIAVRLFRRLDSWELAFYGYWGFWKSPGGLRPSANQAIFPDLNVYGASLRGPVGKGIANAEVGYYDSIDDADGDDPFVNNSEFRFLVGYTREIARDFTAGLQYYLEHMMDYDHYRGNLPAGSRARDEDRHLVTLRLTRLAMNQNLRLGLFTYWSPSDEDAYLRPNINYKASDQLTLEVGANIFLGEHPHTFFGQFEDNTNLYTAVRYSF